jgi:glycosidase
MNSLGTHDTPRALTVFGGDMVKMRLAAVLQYTLPGFPCVFYGDEAGLSGGKDPFCRACYPWGREDAELIEFYRFLGRLRAENKAFADGGFQLLHEGGGVFLFGRGQSSAPVVVGLNASPDPFELETARPLTDLRTGKSVDGEIVIPAMDYVIFKEY